MFFKRWHYKKWGYKVCKAGSCFSHSTLGIHLLSICQSLIFKVLGLILSFGSGKTTPVSIVLSSWTHAWLGQRSPVLAKSPSWLGIRLASAVQRQNHFAVLSSRLCWWLTIMTSSKTSKRPLQILPKWYPKCLPVLGNAALAYCKCQSPSASTLVSVSRWCFALTRPALLRCMMKRTHTGVTGEEPRLVVKKEGRQSFHRWDLLAEFSTRTHCFIVVAVPGVTSKCWICCWDSEQGSFSIVL